MNTDTKGTQLSVADDREAFKRLVEACYGAGPHDAILGAFDAARARTPVASVEAQGAVEVGALVIRVEKMLCAKLGRDWSPAGISVESLIDDLAAAQPPATGAAVALLREVREWLDDAHMHRHTLIAAIDEFLAAAPTIATPPEATDWLAGTVDCDGNPLVTVRDDHLRIAIEFLDAGRGALQTLKGETRESIGAKLRSQVAATPPEVAPTDDARAAVDFDAIGLEGKGHNRDWCAGWNAHVVKSARDDDATRAAGWTLVFDDPRDFCLSASPLIGATYTDAAQAATRINNGTRHTSWGRIRALAASPAADTEGDA